MGYFILPLLVSITLTSLLLSSGLAFADQNPVRIYAAASLTGVMKKISKAGLKKNLPRPTCVHAASSTLARQIDRGAPADIYISANLSWVNYIIKDKFQHAIPRAFASNKIVLITPVDRPLKFSFKNKKSLAQVIGREWVALADPDHVPAGIYAMAALRKLGHWQDVKARIARTANVRGALALVARGEARAGIVYKSDVLGEPRVRVAATFPTHSHPKIRYVALDLATTKASSLYMDFLTSETASGILSEYGFSLLDESLKNPNIEMH